MVVVRYFGGIKLGIPGLIRAYKTSTADAIASGQIVTKIAGKNFKVHFEYLSMNAVMKVLKDMDIQPRAQDFGESCTLEVRVRLSAVADFKNRVENCAKLEEI